jgi:hypothetical protein
VLYAVIIGMMGLVQVYHITLSVVMTNTCVGTSVLRKCHYVIKARLKTFVASLSTTLYVANVRRLCFSVYVYGSGVDKIVPWRGRVIDGGLLKVEAVSAD